MVLLMKSEISVSKISGKAIWNETTGNLIKWNNGMNSRWSLESSKQFGQEVANEIIA